MDEALSGRGIRLKKEDKRGLLEQLIQDCEFLASNGVMDYSMFAGRHVNL